MRHAKDGGDPLDIEDACLTDSSYASTHQTPASSRRDDDTPAVEKLGIDSGGMRSPEERPRVPRFGYVCGGCNLAAPGCKSSRRG